MSRQEGASLRVENGSCSNNRHHPRKRRDFGIWKPEIIVTITKSDTSPRQWISFSSLKMGTRNLEILADDGSSRASGGVNRRRRNCDTDRSQEATNNLGQNHKRFREKRPLGLLLLFAIIYLLCGLPVGVHRETRQCCDQHPHLATLTVAYASLIIGDSAIEIQEVDQQPQGGNQMQAEPNVAIHQQENPQQQQVQFEQVHQQGQQQQQQSQAQDQQPDIILGSNDPSITLGSLADSTGSENNPPVVSQAQQMVAKSESSQSPNRHHAQSQANLRPSLPSPVAGTGSSSMSAHSDDITDGDRRSRPDHDYEPNHSADDKNRVDLGEVLSAHDDTDRDKAITGKVVDFELTPAGGHNKAKIKKKKKKKKKMEAMEAYKKKWGKKKSEEKKAMEKKEKHSMKKKKEEGKKGKKKWGVEEHGQKKKGKFKKKKWGKKMKKGKGVKKGKKGHKMLKDKGHKSTGFKTVYHKEEYGKSAKWHDIKREKKWDEKAKKWKKKWKKEKGKKYKGEHMKKFEKKKKEGKKYKKEKKDKFKKYKKEKFEKGKKMKKEEHGKKKEGGEKKEMKEMKKKMKKKKKKP